LSFDGFQSLIETLHFQFNESNWLFRPFAAFYYHANFVFFGANPYYLSISKILFIFLILFLVKLYLNENNDNWFFSKKYIIATIIVLFHPSQALLMLYSPEVQMIGLIFLGLIIINDAIIKKSRIKILIGLLILIIGSGFKEVGFFSLLSTSVILLMLFVLKNITQKKKFVFLSTNSFKLIFDVLILLFLFYYCFYSYNQITGNVGAINFIDINRLKENLLFILPFQINNNYYQIPLITLFILIIISVKNLFKLLVEEQKINILNKYFVESIFFSSLILMIISLSLDVQYPARTSPRYLYPAAICLYLPLIKFFKLPEIKSSSLKSLLLFLLNIFLAFSIINSANSQLNRLNNFKYAEYSFMHLLNLVSYENFNSQCVYFVNSEMLDYSEIDLTMKHIFSDRGRLFKIENYQSISDFDNNVNNCKNFYLASTRGFLDIKNKYPNLFDENKLVAIFETHDSKEFGDKNSLLNPIPYYESGIINSGNIHPFRIYKFTNSDNESYVEVIKNNQDWNDLDLDKIPYSCFFPIIYSSYNDINFRIIKYSGEVDNVFLRKNDKNYPIEPRVLCKKNIMSIKVKLSSLENDIFIKYVPGTKALTNSLFY